MKVSHTLAALTVALMTSLSLHAADPFVGDGMADKGTHGLVNIFTGWMEIPVRTKHGYDNGIDGMTKKKPALSRTMGTFKGFFHGCGAAVGRTFTGVYQLSGFWAANHETNENVGNQLGKEYAWEKAAPAPESASADRVRVKGARALTDIVVGPAEIPVQTDKTWTVDNDVDPGFWRGAWFATSRLYGGVYDLVGFIAPGDQETYGYAYDSVHPMGDCCDK